MGRRTYGHIRDWIFDLDNTLYPAECDLLGLIRPRMTDYVARFMACDRETARAIQHRYFVDHGTTLAGLITHHGVDPHDYLAYVHDVPLDGVAPDPALAAAIARLPGRKFVFTNGDAPYARRVLERLGLSGVFDGLYDIHDMGMACKPDPRAYQGLCARFGIDPARALFADDMARNLGPARAMGMTTVWIDNGSDQAIGIDAPACQGEPEHGATGVEAAHARIDALTPWIDALSHTLANTLTDTQKENGR